MEQSFLDRVRNRQDQYNLSHIHIETVGDRVDAVVVAKDDTQGKDRKIHSDKKNEVVAELRPQDGGMIRVHLMRDGQMVENNYTVAQNVDDALHEASKGIDELTFEYPEDFVGDHSGVVLLEGFEVVEGGYSTDFVAFNMLEDMGSAYRLTQDKGTRTVSKDEVKQIIRNP